MVSKNYIPGGERSFRGRERDKALKEDVQLQKDIQKIASGFEMIHNKIAIQQLSGKQLFMKYMEMSADEIEKIPQTNWDSIERVLIQTSKKQKDEWAEEYEDMISER